MILFAGSIFNRRHVPDLIRAFAGIAASRRSARLVIVGENRTHPYEALAPLVKSLGLERQVECRSYVPDETLARLYRQARVFAFLSEYEGFGFTPLEALQAGVPIVVADTPVSREIYGRAATYVPVGDVAACAAALAQMLDDEPARQAMLTQAPAVLARYSWDRAARETLEILEQAARSSAFFSARGAPPPRGTDAEPLAQTLAAGLRRSPEPTSANDERRTTNPGQRELAIIIVSYNAADDLRRCLQSLHDAPPAVPHEIVVVDNASQDESVAVAGAWPDVRLIEAGGNLGFARANNLAIRQTASDLILLLNSDTIVPPDAIDRLVADLRAHPEAAIVGPRIVDGDGRAELSFGRMMGPFNELRQKTLVRLHARGIWPFPATVERMTRRAAFPDWVSGACLLVRRRDAEAVGLLDERYFIYAEDVDFCAAVRAAGRRVRFTPDAWITHLRGRSVAAAPVATRQAYRRSQLRFYEKHHPAWAPWLRLYLRLRGRLGDHEN